MIEDKLKGWNYIVYILIKTNFKNKEFTTDDLYAFEPYFKTVYPNNLHIKDKLRQILQNLRDKGLLNFIGKGKYNLVYETHKQNIIITPSQEMVYLLSNKSIPNWVKIGRTNSIERRLAELYNTSIPLPFILEDSLETNTIDDSRILEKSIHSIIDTINPNLRKNTEAAKREFFKLEVDDGKKVFGLVKQIMRIS